MNLFSGIKYNLRGLSLGLKTPKLLWLGIIRFMVVAIITILTAGLILVYHQEILNLMWSKPESQWIIWLWYLFSWLLSVVLVGCAIVLSYLVSQIFFSVFIMDLMSKITEKTVTGGIREPNKIPWWQQFFQRTLPSINEHAFLSPGIWHSFSDSTAQHFVSLICARRCNPLLY